MTATAQPRSDRVTRRAEKGSWLRWGITIFLIVETVHVVVATLNNQWEGWGVFFENLTFVVVSGSVLVALAYGLLVRWGLNPGTGRRNRAALASLVLGLISVLSYAIFFTWAPALLAPGALLLAREGRARADEGERGRWPAIAGGTLGAASLALHLFLVGYVLVEGSYPWGL